MANIVIESQALVAQLAACAGALDVSSYVWEMRMLSGF